MADKVIGLPARGRRGGTVRTFLCWAMRWLCVVTLIAGVVPAQAAEKVTYYYTDPHGTPLAEADEQGNITATFDYRPFGSQALGVPQAGPGYTGHVTDPDSGLIYMQARYHDPVTGRFVSVDPKVARPGDPTAFSRYAYAGNNPIGNIDPDGRQTLPASIYQLNWQDPTTRQVAGHYALNLVPGYGLYDCASRGCGGGSWAMAGVGALPLLAPLREASAVGGIARQAGEMRSLYRAVKPAELTNIRSTGKLALAPGTAEGKYFTTSSSYASQYAKMAVSAFGDEAYTTIKVDVPSSILSSAEQASVDRGIEAYILNEQQLEGLKPLVMDHMDVPPPQ